MVGASGLEIHLQRGLEPTSPNCGQLVPDSPSSRTLDREIGEANNRKN